MSIEEEYALAEKIPDLIRRRLRIRAARLVRLLDLDAPQQVVENEIGLIVKAQAMLPALEPPTGSAN